MHWAIAMAIALVGAVTLFAGAALPAAADTTTSGTCTFSAANYNVVAGSNVTVQVNRTTVGQAGATTVYVQNWSGVMGGSTANTNQAFSFLTNAASASDTWTSSSNALVGAVANLSFASPTDCTGSGTATITVVAGPTITSLNPNTGSTAGNNNVLISGTNFGASPIVSFGGTNAAIVGTPTSTSITATAPPHAAGTIPVTVTDGPLTSAPVNYTYTSPAPPAITSITPNPATAGTSVSINGTNFMPPGATNCPVNVQVQWGATAITNCFLLSDTLITLVVPAGTGTASVTVTTVNGTSSPFTFTYGTGTTPPSITSVTPSSGPVGTVLTITGSNLAPSSSVTVGGVNCPIVSGSTDTQLTCTTQGNAPSLTQLNVVVNALGGSATATNAFYYTNSSAVTVTNVIPNTCPLAGGNTLYVYGTGFIDGSTTVKVNGVIASNLNVISSTQLSVTCPGQNSYGTYDLSVTSGGNTSANTVNDNVTYQAGGAAPVISNVQPASGPTTGGTAVTITGANFVSPATVTFDGIAATSVVVVSTTTITAVTPAHAATGLVTVAVSTGNGTDTDVYAFTYTNTAAPTVTAVSPNSGPVGTTVTVTGTNFLGATGVTIGGVAATFNVTSNTTLTATVASGTPLGVVNVLVTTPSGTSANTVNDNFTNTNSKTLTTTLTGFFTLIGWVGVDNISVADALRGGPNGPSGGTNNITAQVSVVWGFNSATQTFLAYFPAQANVPGANDLTTLRSGVGYFIGLLNPNTTVQWTYALGA